MKKRILCYGDSNTWGYIPEGQPDGFHMRFPEDIRWTGVLQNALGDSFAVVEEGLNGRTTSFDQRGFRCRNGLTYLESSLLTHEPIDIAVIYLGINDLKVQICGDPKQSAESLAALLDFVSRARLGPEGGPTKVLLVLPPPLGAGILHPPFRDEFGGGAAIEASRQLNREYRRIAERFGIESLDAAAYTETGADGIHLTAESHVMLGHAIAQKVQDMLAEGA
ncbi:MAG: SGNH/GDSL hydrolase family protein [Clostridia bacterium]|nr:SGNH/GDSL hydrolase family protein [Clostridia bacterium]